MRNINWSNVTEYLNKLIPWPEINLLLEHLQQKPAAHSGIFCFNVQPDGIRCAYIRDNNTKPELQWCEFIANTNLKNTETLLHGLLEKYKLEGVACSWILSPSDYKIFTVEALPVPAQELSAALRWRIKDLINFPLDDALIDFFPIVAPGAGKADNLNVVVCRKADLQTKLQLFQQSGLNIQVIDIPELALRNITHLFAEDAQGTMLFWLKPTNSQIIFTRQNRLYLERTVSQSLMPLCAPNLEQLTPDLEKMLDNLCLELQRSMDYYRSQLRQTLPASFFITTTHSKILNYLAERLTAKPVTLPLSSVLPCKQTITNTLLTDCLAVIGGALRKETMKETMHAATN